MHTIELNARLEEHPEATEEEASEATVDHFAGLGDYFHDQTKDRQMEKKDA